MEYGYLIVQSSFILLTIFSTFDRYLVNNDKYYKKTKKIEIIVQGICLVSNLIILFLMKEIMIYILIIHVILMSMILGFYSRKAKKLYFDELLNIIIANDLQFVDSKVIKKIILEKYNKVYFVEDIEKCKNHIKKVN